MDKPEKPSITIPESFAENGIKTDFDSNKLLNGFDRLNPDVLAGDNLNKFIDDTYKGLNYGIKSVDYLEERWKSQITNCLLEVPQRIKLELNDGVLTLKAGSQVIVPNGFEADGTTPKFDYVDIESDKTVDCASTTGKCLIRVYPNGYAYGSELASSFSSGTDPSGMTGITAPFYNTTTNRISYHVNGVSDGIYFSLPIAEITLNNGSVSSIDQVFNGMGYIGSTIWVDKGVKGLIPNGRNEDGSLNSVEFETSRVLAHTNTNYLNNVHWIICDGSKIEEWDSVYWIGYNEEKNIIYDKNGSASSKDGNQIACSVIAYMNHDGTERITSFQPKLPFRAVDYNDKTLPQVDGQWVKKDYKLLVDGSATGGESVTEGAYSATFDLSSYLPNEGHDYLVTVRIYSRNASTATAYNNFRVNGGYGLMAMGKVSGKSVFQEGSIIVPIDKNHKLYVENAPSSGTSTSINIMLVNYRRIGTNN